MFSKKANCNIVSFMQRIEFIINQSVDEVFTSLCEKYQVGKFYTKIPNVTGNGFSGAKLGTPQNPGLNNMYIIYAPKEDIPMFKKIIETLRTQYPDAGVACFLS